VQQCMSAAVGSISCVSLYGNHCSTIIALCLMCMPGFCQSLYVMSAGCCWQLRLPDNRTLQPDQHFSLSMLTASSVLEITYASSFPPATSSLCRICCKTGSKFWYQESCVNAYKLWYDLHTMLSYHIQIKTLCVLCSSHLPTW